MFAADDSPEEGDLASWATPRRTAEEKEEFLRTCLQEFDAKQFQIGDTIPQRWFYDLLAVPHPTVCNSLEQIDNARLAFLALFGEFRQYVLDHRKRYLKSNWAKGLEILEPAAQTKYAQRKRHSEIAKALHDEQSLLTNVDRARLSIEQRVENADAIAHNVKLADILRSRKKSQ